MRRSGGKISKMTHYVEEIVLVKRRKTDFD